MNGALGMGLLSLKRLHGGGLGGELLHRGPWKICSDKSLDTGISLHRGPYRTEGNLVSGGEARIAGTLKDG